MLAASMSACRNHATVLCKTGTVVNRVVPQPITHSVKKEVTRKVWRSDQTAYCYVISNHILMWLHDMRERFSTCSQSMYASVCCVGKWEALWLKCKFIPEVIDILVKYEIQHWHIMRLIWQLGYCLVMSEKYQLSFHRLITNLRKLFYTNQYLKWPFKLLNERPIGLKVENNRCIHDGHRSIPPLTLLALKHGIPQLPPRSSMLEILRVKGQIFPL